MPYTQYGPFTDGSAPGITASFLNQLETFLSTINALASNSAITPTTINGTTSGTISQWLLGGPTTGSSANCFKLYLFYFNAYQNSTGVRQRITLPSPFATGGIAWVGGIHVPTSGKGIYTVDNTTGGHNFNVFNGYNSSLSQAVLPCYAIGEFNNEMSYMDIDGSTSGAANGWVMLMGI